MNLNPMFSRTLALAAPVTALTLSSAGAAQSDYFLKIDGIKGESADTDHKEWIVIESFSWGVSHSGVQADGGAGKATFKEFTVTKKTDRSSPPLMLRCATGTHIPTVKLEVRRETQPGTPPPEGYYTITLENVVVSSFNSTGVAGDAAKDKPIESFSLNFTKIEFKYVPQDGSAPVVEIFDNSGTTGSP